MLVNNNKILSNNGVMPSIILGKRYRSFFTTNNTSAFAMYFSYINDDKFTIYYGDGSNSILSLTSFEDRYNSHSYSSVGYYDIIIEANEQYITKLDVPDSNYSSVMICNLSGIFQYFTQLEYLDIHRNTISQSVSGVFAPKNLKYLDLSYCYAIGDIMTMQLPNTLEYLDVAYNSFTSDLSNIIFSTSLKHISLYGNYFSGDVSNWSFPDTLEYFEIGYSNSAYSGVVDNWDFSSTNLNTLNINYAEFTGDITNWIVPNTLEEFNIGYTTLSGDITNIDWSNTLLINFYIFLSNNLTGLIENLILPDSVTHITCSNSQLTGSFNDFIIPSATTYINLSNNDIDFDVTNYTIPSNLTTLNLSSNNIFGDATNIVFNTTLTTLDIRSSDITGTIAWSSVPDSLDYIYVNGCTNLIIDLDNIDINMVHTFWFTSCSGVTGSISNLDTTYIRNLWASSLDITGTVNFDNFSSSLSRITLNNNTSLTGDITNINNYTSLYEFRLDNTDIYGDVSSWTEIKYNYLEIDDTQVSGSCATWIPYAANISVNISNTTITGVDIFMDNIFDFRRNYSTVIGIYYYFYNLSEIVNNPTDWVKQSGNTGTYTGNIFDLSENEIENLVSGLDYDGLGTNTPWTSGEQVWWMENAEKSSIDSSSRYKNLNFVY